MKRVRFETPTKPLHYIDMNDFECQSPRPFIEKRTIPFEPRGNYGYAEFSNDPLQRYETANSSPYPVINKTKLTEFSQTGSKWLPSNDLELSMLDPCRQMAINIRMRESNICAHSIDEKIRDKNVIKESNMENNISNNVKTNSRVLTSLENTYSNPSNMLNKHDDFFLRRHNLQKLYVQSTQSIDSHFKKMSIDKENNPYVAKSELMKECTSKALSTIDKLDSEIPMDPIVAIQDYCKCCHCKNIEGQSPVPYRLKSEVPQVNLHSSYNKLSCHQHLMSNPCGNCPCHIPLCNKIFEKCSCSTENLLVKDKNTVDKKTWALEKYESSKGTSTLDIDKEVNLKEKREPTVADLFKIIKLQNEQLQLLQDKVDKFISGSKSEAPKQQLPLQTNYITEHMSVESVDKGCHKISIGVMTSFEMVRTSTIINKEIVKQSSEAQIQCNRSQISMKEIIQPENIKFLDGIMPMVKNNSGLDERASVCKLSNIQHVSENFHKDNANEEKTLNELSLYNVQVDNATTPLMSPDQSLYLDVRDYSDSDSECVDQSNVGWTYYNKVMTHVNGMLHDSDMPSSASALYRNTRQKCMQMKIDKTNVSVIKRVKFGDDPVGVHQHAPTTDTSLKMNQLAAKYLKKSTPSVPQASQKPTADMSIATRNYMEKHHLLQGIRSQPAQTVEIPRFLDITALKQQPKLL